MPHLRVNPATIAVLELPVARLCVHVARDRDTEVRALTSCEYENENDRTATHAEKALG
jgi:hypothetical protein